MDIGEKGQDAEVKLLSFHHFAESQPCMLATVLNPRKGTVGIVFSYIPDKEAFPFWVVYRDVRKLL